MKHLSSACQPNNSNTFWINRSHRTNRGTSYFRQLFIYVFYDDIFVTRLSQWFFFLSWNFRAIDLRVCAFESMGFALVFIALRSLAAFFQTQAMNETFVYNHYMFWRCDEWIIRTYDHIEMRRHWALRIINKLNLLHPVFNTTL